MPALQQSGDEIGRFVGRATRIALVRRHALTVGLADRITRVAQIDDLAAREDRDVAEVRLATLAKSIELDCARELLDVALTRTRQLPELAGRTEEACRAYEGTSTASAARAA